MKPLKALQLESCHVSFEQNKLKHTGLSTLRRSWSVSKLCLADASKNGDASYSTHAHAAVSTVTCKKACATCTLQDHIDLSAMHTMSPLQASQHSDVAADTIDCCRESPHSRGGVHSIWVFWPAMGHGANLVDFMREARRGCQGARQSMAGKVSPV